MVPLYRHPDLINMALKELVRAQFELPDTRRWRRGPPWSRLRSTLGSIRV